MLYSHISSFIALSFLFFASTSELFGLDPEKMYHFRNGEQREWDRYSNEPDASQFLDTFDWSDESDAVTLKLSQVDVKQRWQVSLNDIPLGNLVQDENPMVIYFEVDPQILKEQDNRLEVINIQRNPKGSDDIVIGRMQVLPYSIKEIVNETRLTVKISENGQPTPARITILNEQGELHSVGSESNQTLAVRPGTVYTSDGTATFGLPAGKYTIYAGRGFEYSLPSKIVEVSKGEKTIKFEIERQVDTTGYVACDTHVHTRTHSGHGDSTVQERMITLAGEGIELPIATDHNVQIDHRPFADEMKVSHYFTPVPGNEVTTPVGHFNIFPVKVDQEIPHHKLKDWTEIFTEIERATQAPIVILNHARDVHSGVTPFGPSNHLSIVGDNLNDWPIGFNAMEIINSGATQTDPLQLTQDWMNLLNAGYQITPVGSSDSHDVARHFVGQGRTYIRCDDSDPANIDIDEAVSSFKKGNVAVSYGLLTFLDVQPSEKDQNQIAATVEVRLPDWIECHRIQVFANGQQVADVSDEDKFQTERTGHSIYKKFVLQKPQHDTIYIAVATGPGIEEPYWKTAFPYQPDSDFLDLKVLGVSRAHYFDSDQDGQQLSAKDYASEIYASANGDVERMLAQLQRYDDAVAFQLFHLYSKKGGSFEGKGFQNAIQSVAPDIKRSFETYFRSWRASQLARLKAN